MVGDRLDTDIAGAKRAGLFAVRVKQGRFANDSPSSDDEMPDAEIMDISELISIMRGFGK